MLKVDQREFPTNMVVYWDNPQKDYVKILRKMQAKK